jgi:carboxyl-terminal processing protease
MVLGVAVGTLAANLNSFVLEDKSLNKGLPKNLDYSSVEEVYDALRVNYEGELTEEEILNGLKAGLARSTGDPYTTFLSKEDNEDFDSQLSGTFTGVGAELIEENNLVVVATPLSGFPAEKAGVSARDIIFKIDGEDATQLSVSEAVKKIRGEKGTTVVLTLIRDGEQLEISIVRDVINIPSVKSEVIDGIGYMTIYRFGDDTASLARKYANEYKTSNLKGVIVDLRNNPGGYLDQSVKVASLWLDKNAVVVEEKRGDVSIKKDLAVGSNILKGIKTVILINGGSASASEILAGALRDSNAATLIGEKTFGKGSVQQLEEFSNNTALKVTVAKWFTPAGKNIDKEGISPDKEVLYTIEDSKNKVDPQKNAALEFFK